MSIIAMFVVTFWFIIFALLAVVGGIVFAYKHRRQPLVALLFALGMGGVIAGALVGVSRQSGPQATVVMPSMSVSPRSGPTVLAEATPQASDPTLEALWDKLTKSRINLGADSEEPAADPKDEKAKEAVKDTFGLDDKGKLPPKWVITPPKQVGQVYRASVASDPWVTEEDCRQELVENILPQAVARRIEYLAPSRVNRKVSVADPLSLGIGPDYILREICRDEFTGTVDSSVGEMKKVHVLLEFDENIDNYLVDAWLRHERQIRFASVSKVAALSLTGLAAIYGLLRFDTWSKGYYSRQLLVGGTLAIIALAVFVLRVS
jgi:hypothetical protein